MHAMEHALTIDRREPQLIHVLGMTYKDMGYRPSIPCPSACSSSPRKRYLAIQRIGEALSLRDSDKDYFFELARLYNYQGDMAMTLALLATFSLALNNHSPILHGIIFTPLVAPGNVRLCLCSLAGHQMAFPRPRQRHHERREQCPLVCPASGPRHLRAHPPVTRSSPQLFPPRPSKGLKVGGGGKCWEKAKARSGPISFSWEIGHIVSALVLGLFAHPPLRHPFSGSDCLSVLWQRRGVRGDAAQPRPPLVKL